MSDLNMSKPKHVEETNVELNNVLCVHIVRPILYIGTNQADFVYVHTEEGKRCFYLSCCYIVTWTS